MNRIEIVATGPELIKYGVRGFESVVEEIIDSAQREIFAVSYVTGTGAFPLIKRMAQAAEHGVKVSLLKSFAIAFSPYYCNDEKGKDLYQVIVELTQPQIIVCGHMHDSLREEFAEIPVVGLGKKEIVPVSEFLRSINCCNRR